MSTDSLDMELLHAAVQTEAWNREPGIANLNTLLFYMLVRIFMWIWCTVHTVSITTPGCSAAVLRAAADRVLPGNGGELSGNTNKGVSKISQNTLHWRNFTVNICDFSENLCVQATQF